MKTTKKTLRDRGYKLVKQPMVSNFMHPPVPNIQLWSRDTCLLAYNTKKKKIIFWANYTRFAELFKKFLEENK